jgi:UDP-3-O-acyl-N-acetylglucosamine deacetylase
MWNDVPGRVILGDEATVRAALARWSAQPVDQEFFDETPVAPEEATLEREVSVSGPGTFFGRAQRTLTFLPARSGGWRFDRTDLPESLPIGVGVGNVWTTARNIVLCSGSPRNYMRMVEHIIALRAGMSVDHVLIRQDSGDPPLFDRSSMDLVEAFDTAGRQPLGVAAPVWTVREPVTAAGPGGSFLTFLPPADGGSSLRVDCAVDFPSAIGKQRIRFDVTPRTFRHGAAARTNTTFGMMFFVKTIGLLFADTRNLGYTPRNILITRRRRYHNRPGLLHNGKSLEAVWHRAVLDLLAAVALIDRGRFAGRIVSYKAGHDLDCGMIKELYERSLLVRV